MLIVSSTILQVNHLQQLNGSSHLRTNLCSLMSQYHWILVFTYVTISPSRSARCETKKPPAMRVRVEGYTKKTPNAIQ